MPELPEAETIVRELHRKIAGKTISRFFVFDRKMKKPRIPLPSRVLGVRRRGKYIIFDLDCGQQCFIHLRMTGALLLKKQQSKNRSPKEMLLSKRHEKHERARFYFHDGSTLRFVDVRRFGTIEWLKSSRELPVLGIDPLSRGFHSRRFASIIRENSRAIKSILLDQKKIAGIGNIYADEILWTAKIHPARIASSLNVREVGELIRAVRGVLREAIKKGGITIRDYRRTGGESGYYQHSRKVYDREGQKCLRCKTKIERMKLGGRSSYFCPRCQK